MASSRSTSSLMLNQESIFYWLADLLSSEQGYGEWMALDHLQRTQWLDDEGYDASELSQSLDAYALTPNADPALVGALRQLLLRGDPIPDALLDPLQNLVISRVNRVEARAGGVGIGSSAPSVRNFFKPHLLSSFRAMQESMAKANKLYTEAAESKLGLYVDTLGGIQEKAVDHVDHQLQTDKLKATNIKDNAQSKAKTLENKEKNEYKEKKSSFISQKEAVATQKEEQALEGGKENTDWKKLKTESSPPTLGSKAKEVVQLDRSYYEANYKEAVDKNMIIQPKITREENGSSQSVSMSYDWKGERGTVTLDQKTLATEQDTILRAVNILTAKALWSSHVKQQLQTLKAAPPQWRPQAMGLHPEISQQAFAMGKNTFPKAKVPSTLKQAQQEKATATKTLKQKKLKAERHGVTAFSLERQRDEKRIMQNLGMDASNPQQLFKQLKGREASLRANVSHSLEAMVLAQMVADAKHQLTSNSKAQALRAQHASTIASWHQSLANADSSISFTDRKLNISWGQGSGLKVSRTAKDSSSSNSGGPSLKISSQNSNKDGLNISVNDNHGRISYDAITQKDDGEVVRQHGNTFTITSGETKQWDEIQSEALKESRMFERSLELSALADAQEKAQTFAKTNKDPRLLKLITRSNGLDHAKTLLTIVHDISVDRRIESKLTHNYGSLRSQKIVMNQTIDRLKQSQIDVHATIKRAKRLNTLLHDGNKVVLRKARLIHHQLEKGRHIDEKDLQTLHRVYKSKPFEIKKNTSGTGYKIDKTKSKRKDYWKTLSQKQRYAIFNPMYISEKTFYTTERSAFLAGKATYIDLRRQGASKKMARASASEVYLSTLLGEDTRQLKNGYSTEKLAYAPFIFKRQIHIIKRVVYLNRHSAAWKLRVAFKVKREKFVYTHIVKYHQYMVNNKFTGFHPFHRMGRFAVHKINFIRKYTLEPIHHAIHHLWKDEIAFFSPKAATWIGTRFHKTTKTLDFIGWHAIKGLWHLPDRLYKHGKYFLHQGLFAITHFWEYRKIWGGIKRDFRGPWRLAKFAYHLMAYSDSVLFRSIVQVGKSIGGDANWSSVAMGAYHKKLYKKASTIGDAMKFAGLAGLIGKTKLTKTAIAIDRARMQMRRELHKTGFASAAWRHAIKKHTKLVNKYKDMVVPSQANGLVKAAENERKSIHSHWKKYMTDIAKAKISPSYKASLVASVHADYQADKARISSFTSQLKPEIHAAIHTDIHDIINKLSSASNKSQKVKVWTLHQYEKDIDQSMRIYKAYNQLDTFGKKELAYATRGLLVATKASKENLIKDAVKIMNSGVKKKRSEWKTFFKSSSKSTTYAYAVKQDWLNMGMYIGGTLLGALQKSIYNTKAGTALGKDIKKHHLGSKTFDDIVGGFWIHHYLQVFLKKDPGLVSRLPAARTKAEAITKTIDVVLKQPVVQKVFKHWLKLNQRSPIAKDYLKVQAYHQHKPIDKRLKKWRRVEKIGNTQVTATDLATLSSLHKNQLLGLSLAEVVARTTKWQDLTLSQREQYRNEYNTWLSYNQKKKGLDSATKTFDSKHKSEVAGWQTDRAEIESGQSLSVGDLLLSVKQNDTKHSNWVAIPKPPLSHFNEHLSSTATYLQQVAHDPGLLAVSIQYKTNSHSSIKNKDQDPSLLAFYMQLKMLRHQYHKIKKWLASRNEKKVREKAEKDAKDAKEAKEDGKEQVKEAKEDVRDGKTNEQELINDAVETDGKTVSKLADDEKIRKLADNTVGSEANQAEQLVKEEEEGNLKVSKQEAKEVEREEEDALERDEREELSNHQVLDEVKESMKAEKDIANNDIKTKLDPEAQGLAKEEEKDLTHDELIKSGDKPGEQIDAAIDQIGDDVKTNLFDEMEDLSDVFDAMFDESVVVEDDLIEVML